MRRYTHTHKYTHKYTYKHTYTHTCTQFYMYNDTSYNVSKKRNLYSEPQIDVTHTTDSQT